MRYTILLFDLDDTLLDFGANEKASLTKLFEQNGYLFTDELFQRYNAVNKQLWGEYERGAIPIDVVLNNRFSQTMEKLGKAVDGQDWERQYRELLGHESHQIPIEGALEVCQRLSATHRLFIVTNGVSHTQVKRLKQTGLHEFFEDIFDSQSIGHQKPSTAFFDHVIRHIPGFDRREALVIGDSLNTDIQGGLLSGIDTCWFCRRPESVARRQDIISTYTISSLSELVAICSAEQ